MAREADDTDGLERLIGPVPDAAEDPPRLNGLFLLGDTEGPASRPATFTAALEVGAGRLGENWKGLKVMGWGKVDRGML